MTLKYYTHPTYMSAKEEMERINKQKQFYYQFTTIESENIRNYKNICELQYFYVPLYIEVYEGSYHR